MWKNFLDSFIRDLFQIILNFDSSIILICSKLSKNFIIDNKLDKFYNYLIIDFRNVFMVSANDLILFYLGLELQSLSLYILASIDRDNLRSTESGLNTLY